MSEHTELKACPFCGGDDIEPAGCFGSNCEDTAETVAAVCQGCEAQGPFVDEGGTRAPGGDPTPETIAASINAWNTRAPSPSHEAMKTALRWYASEEAWRADQVEGPDGDYGKRARNALSQAEEG